MSATGRPPPISNKHGNRNSLTGSIESSWLRLMLKIRIWQIVWRLMRMQLAIQLRNWRKTTAAWLLSLLAGCATPTPAPAPLQTECPRLAIPPALLVPPPEPNFQKNLADYFSANPDAQTKPQPMPRPVIPGSGS